MIRSIRSIPGATFRLFTRGSGSDRFPAPAHVLADGARLRGMRMRPRSPALERIRAIRAECHRASTADARTGKLAEDRAPRPRLTAVFHARRAESRGAAPGDSFRDEPRVNASSDAGPEFETYYRTLLSDILGADTTEAAGGVRRRVRSDCDGTFPEKKTHACGISLTLRGVNAGGMRMLRAGRFDTRRPATRFYRIRHCSHGNPESTA